MGYPVPVLLPVLELMSHVIVLLALAALCTAKRCT